ncbi:MAG: tRNA uridine-5-carboxymethylaminomethyl(34) synthesis GTPase MnmE [Clostridia bacterium]|nr:tRNA uridine-5-carboxymethylaminomethyl(34) synthesis GTPase MnmE [Clostridia bacterium]
MTDTIVAIATAAGRGGVAIVRLSGNPVPIAEKMFIPQGKTAVAQFESHKMYTGKIDCGAFSDFGLCVLFRAPKSFTGEDVAEFHCHGGVQIARGIVQRAISLGARLAERGEYTKRAFLNGKLSLASAEGMVDMINGESEAEVRAGFALYGETLTRKVKVMQDDLTNLLAGIDCDIDYPEEDLEFASEDAVRERLVSIKGKLDALLKGYGVGKKIKQGVTVVIAGRPNAGKSSLLNVLLGYDRAIVSSVPGTTRDSVEGTVEIEGVRFNLIDTAGLRESDDEIEQIGVKRAERLVKSADVLLYLFEEWTKEDESFVGGLTVPCVLVRTKADKGTNGKSDLAISSASGEGIDRLKTLLYEKGVGETNDGAFLVEERHYAALRKAKESLREAIANVGVVPSDVIAVDLRDAWDALGEITGETASETVINEIFAKFCVGK